MMMTHGQPQPQLPLQPPQPGQRVLSAAHVERYAWHTPQPVDKGPWLDLTLLTTTATPCSSYEQMMHQYVHHPVVVALLGVDIRFVKQLEAEYQAAEKKDPEERKRLVRQRVKHINPFHRLSPSYLCLPFGVLVRDVFGRLAPFDRNLATLILPHQPVHYYADLDGGYGWCLAEGAAEQCQLEFTRLLTAYFRKRFSRAPDLSGMHWEQANRAGKLSLHVHLTTEAFATHLDLQAFDRNFQSFLRQDRKSTTSFVCRRIIQEGEEEDRYECLLDPSVYNVHSLVRLHGNCKPHGPMLVQCGLKPDSPPLSDAELLWRGLPNHALPPQPYAYLRCPPDRARASSAAAAAAGMKRGRGGSSASSSSSAAASSQLDAAPEQKRALLELLAEYVGPEVQLRECTVDASQLQWRGACTAGTAWCVRLKHRTHPGRVHIHRSNRTVFSSTVRGTLLLRCLHPDCQGDPLEVDMTETLRGRQVEQQKQQSNSGEWILQEAPPPSASGTPDEEASFLRRLMPVVEVDIDKLDCTRSKELAAFAQQYMQSPGSVTFLQSQQGTGKTEFILQQLAVVEQRAPEAWRKERTLWNSTRRNYANSLGERIRQFERDHWKGPRHGRGQVKVDGLQFADYTEYPNDDAGNRQMLSMPRLILSLESLERLVDKRTGEVPRFHRVVLDELEELLRVFHSSTMNGRRARVFTLWLQILQHADQVWVADADLHPDTGVRFIREHLLPGKQVAYLLNHRQTIQREYRFIADHTRQAMCALQSLRAGLKCFIVSNGKADILALARWLGEQLGGCKVREEEAPQPLLQQSYMDDAQVEEEEEEQKGDGDDAAPVPAAAAAATEPEPGFFSLRVVTGESSDEDKRRLMTDASAWTQHSALVVSPVVGPGINFDEEYFDVAFLLVGRRTTSPCQVFQQLNRVRRLRLQAVYVYVAGQDETPEAGDVPWSLERVQLDVQHQLHLFQRRQDGMLRVEYAARDDRLVPVLPDTGYNAVFFRNELHVRDGRARMCRLLQQQMRRAGGTVWRAAVVIPQWQQRKKECAEQLQDAHQACKDDWARRIAAAPDLGPDALAAVTQKSQMQQATEEDRLALHKHAIRICYSLPLNQPMSAEWVRSLGEPIQMSKFQRLLVAAQGGTAFLQFQGGGGDVTAAAAPPLHLLQEFFLMHTAEQLLRGLQFDSWRSFLAAEQRGKMDDKAAVRQVRSFFKEHFGVGLLRHAKQVNKRRCVTYEVEPVDWIVAGASAVEVEEAEAKEDDRRIWQRIEEQAKLSALAAAAFCIVI